MLKMKEYLVGNQNVKFLLLRTISIRSGKIAYLQLQVLNIFKMSSLRSLNCEDARRKQQKRIQISLSSISLLQIFMVTE